jgi:formamidopyrimidine-DNA glycosylase
MPELPEVEANMRNFAAWTVGRRMTRITPPPGKRETGGTSPAEFVARLEGRRVEEVSRKGKWILARLDGNAGLGLHLGMTGKIIRCATAGGAGRGEMFPELPRFTRAVFEMSDRTHVCFVDMRRFGKLYAARSYDELAARPEIAAIGPDALRDLDARTLRDALAATARTVKETIMDQRVLAGVGNLYATDALWRARIHPASSARAVAEDPAAVRALLGGIRAALRHGIREYAKVDVPEYIEEGAPNPFYAYDRGGEPCKRCKTRLRTMTLGGRTTVWCPKCQRRLGKGR